jgi:O-antigen ligase
MAFAGQMQLFSLMALALALTGAYKKTLVSNRLAFGSLLTGNVLGLIFAAERSAWLGFVIGAALIAICTSWRLALKLSAASVAAFLIAWNTLPVFKNRLLPLLDWQHDVSTRARLIVWEQAWKQFLLFPLFGVGVRKFPHIYIPEALVPGQAKYLSHAHSNYLHALATTGLFGLAMYLWLLASSISLAWQQFVKGRFDARDHEAALSFNGATALGLLGALVSLAVAGAFEYNFGTSQVRLAEWFLLALLCAPKNQNDSAVLNFDNGYSADYPGQGCCSRR